MMASQTPYRDTLLRHFCGDLLQRTMDTPTAAAHQQALHGFLDDLSPWVLPHELPILLGPAFTLFDACEFTPTADGTDEEVAVVALSPQGEVLFRAWLRRRGVDPVLCSS
jgi:hypothetical protein